MSNKKKLRKRVKVAIEAAKEDRDYLDSEMAMEDYELASYTRDHIPTTLWMVISALKDILKKYDR